MTLGLYGAKAWLMSNPRQSLAPYASQAATSRGRYWPEQEADFRSPFQRDRDRIVHAEAFRKLQYKTQVFLVHEGSAYRTRLTHSLEVAQLTRSICRALRLDEDLGEATALAHDLGHPPFGHAGERGLNDALGKLGLPRFDHNLQSLRILTSLEQRYPGFDGLNLTWESLEGIAKHNGPQPAPPPALAALDASLRLELQSYASLEAQIAALADDLAYLTHDIDDGLRAGLLRLEELPELDLLGNARAALPPGLDAARLRAGLVRELIHGLVTDLLNETGRRLSALPLASSDAVRQAAGPLAAFSADIWQDLSRLRRFLQDNLWHHPSIWNAAQEARAQTSALFERLWQSADYAQLDEERRAVQLTDKIASLTDSRARELATL